MTWVKICGTTNLEDALAALDAGADAVGFVFYEKSPRCVNVETAREIVEKLPKSIEKVGVFAGDSIEHAVDMGRRAGFDALQVYLLTYRKAPKSELTASATGGQRLKAYLALPVSMFLREGSTVAGFSKERPADAFDALFLDSGGSQKPGGTGVPFDWREAATAVKQLSLRQKIVVAGGLTPQNVGEAMEILKPWGVDVVSGVEARPGKKDPQKVRAFVRAVREMDRKAS